MTNKKLREVYIVDGSRTPFLKAKTQVGPFSASDLAVATAKELLLRQPFNPQDLSEVICGCMMPGPDEANIGRIIALRLGCGDFVPGWTVQRNCASGLQSVDNAFQDIAMGRSELVLAGGTDAMSHAPILYPENMANWLGRLNSSKSLLARLSAIAQFRPSYLKPIIALLQGLTDPIVGLSMGQTAENLAYMFKLTRKELDGYALRSHQLSLAAREHGYLKEITPIYDAKGKVYSDDDGVRADTSLEKLATLKPFFDKTFGMVTAGNSSQVTDGAAFLILASEDAVKRHGLPVLAKIIDTEWAALNPAIMGLGPVHAIIPLLQRNKLELKDINYWEINEAFSAEILGCLAALKDPIYCKEQFGLSKPMGEIPIDHLNIDGGAVALGHPIGASGARILLHLTHVLQRQKAKLGIATLCIGGGQGGAMLIERM